MTSKNTEQTLFSRFQVSKLICRMYVPFQNLLDLWILNGGNVRLLNPLAYLRTMRTAQMTDNTPWRQ
jgi:hypothetical protein